MYKKMLSMMVALMLILSVFAAMPAMAAGEAFTSTFEGDAYVVGGVLNDATLGWTIQSTDTMYTKIVDVPAGYDGRKTKAMQIGILEAYDNISLDTKSNTPGRGRILAKGIVEGWPDLTKTTIEQYDIYVDENFLGSFRMGSVQINAQTDGNPTVNARVSDLTNGWDTSFGTLENGWNRVQVIRHYVDGATTGAKATVIINGNITTYKGRSPYGTFAGTLQLLGKNLARYSKDDYLIIDNVQMGYATETTVDSELNGAEGVKVDTEEITLNFSERILEDSPSVTAIEEGYDIAPADFTVSGGVEVEEVTVAADRKSVTLTLDRELEYQTTYTVSVAGIMDMYSNAITGSISFTTENLPDFVAKKPVFKKEALFEGGEGRKIEALENGYVSCQYSLQNNTDAEKDALMFVVLWKNGMIDGFMFNPQVMAAQGGKASLYGGFNVTDAENSKIEAYCWNAFFKLDGTGMQPLMPKVTIDKDGITATGVIEE